MNYIEFDGIKVFGNTVGIVSEAELNILKLDNELEVHLLRHYSEISSDYMNTLLNQDIEENMIRSALNTIGSKFTLNLQQENIENPKKLLARIQLEAQDLIKNHELQFVNKGGKRFTAFSFMTDLPIGYEGLVSIASIPQDLKVNLIKKHRGEIDGDEFQVWSIRNYKSNMIQQIAVELYFDLHINKLLHITAYPGKYSPDFPNRNQSIEEQKYNKQFWDAVAFITE